MTGDFERGREIYGLQGDFLVVRNDNAGGRPASR